MNDGLIVTGAISPITVGTGLASLHGLIYWNSERLDIDIPTPTTMPRVDRLVLRIDWEEHTVRVAHILGEEGAGPPLMDVDDKILDEALACISIGLDGVITVENNPNFEILSRDKSLDNQGQNVV